MNNDKTKKLNRRKMEAKKKLSAKKILKNSLGYSDEDITPRDIGRAASTHCSSCSCPMCGNPRKFYGEKTRQETIEDLRELDED